MRTGFLPQQTQPRAWGPAPFTQLPEGTQVSRCCLESSGRNSGQHWTGGAPFQPGLCFSLGTGHQGRPGSRLTLENWMPDTFLKKQLVLWETVGLLSLPECEAGQESSSRTSPGVSSCYPQQGAWHAGSQELFPCSESVSPPLLDAEGPGGSPPPALVAPSGTKKAALLRTAEGYQFQEYHPREPSEHSGGLSHLRTLRITESLSLGQSV